MNKRELATKIVEAINDEENNYDAVDVVTQILEDENETEETESE